MEHFANDKLCLNVFKSGFELYLFEGGISPKFKIVFNGEPQDMHSDIGSTSKNI